MTGDSHPTKPGPRKPLYGPRSASTPAAGISGGSDGPNGPQTGAESFEGGREAVHEAELASAGPHSWAPKGWRYWICRHCYAPKSLHPRKTWVVVRPLHDNTYLSPRAPHFEEGW